MQLHTISKRIYKKREGDFFIITSTFGLHGAQRGCELDQAVEQFIKSGPDFLIYANSNSFSALLIVFSYHNLYS